MTIFDRILSVRRHTLHIDAFSSLSVGRVRAIRTVNVCRTRAASRMTGGLGVAIKALAITVGTLMGGKCIRHVQVRGSHEIMGLKLAGGKHLLCHLRSGFRERVMGGAVHSVRSRRIGILLGNLGGLRNFLFKLIRGVGRRN